MKDGLLELSSNWKVDLTEVWELTESGLTFVRLDAMWLLTVLTLER